MAAPRSSAIAASVTTKNQTCHTICPPVGGTEGDLDFFFVRSEILGIHIWRKKRVNYDKFEIATRQR